MTLHDGIVGSEVTLCHAMTTQSWTEYPDSPTSIKRVMRVKARFNSSTGHYRSHYSKETLCQATFCDGAAGISTWGAGVGAPSSSLTEGVAARDSLGESGLPTLLRAARAA